MALNITLSGVIFLQVTVYLAYFHCCVMSGIGQENKKDPPSSVLPFLCPANEKFQNSIKSLLTHFG